jgi:hypothetical protein
MGKGIWNHRVQNAKSYFFSLFLSCVEKVPDCEASVGWCEGQGCTMVSNC